MKITGYPSSRYKFFNSPNKVDSKIASASWIQM